MGSEECQNSNGQETVDHSECVGLGRVCGGGDECCCISKQGSWVNIIFGRQDLPEELNILGWGLATSDLKSIVRTILIIATSGLGVGLIGVNAYGGYTWITAGDNEEQLIKAKKIFKDGWVGIGIAFGFIAVLAILAYILRVNVFDFSALDDVL